MMLSSSLLSSKSKQNNKSTNQNVRSIDIVVHLLLVIISLSVISGTTSFSPVVNIKSINRLDGMNTISIKPHDTMTQLVIMSSNNSSFRMKMIMKRRQRTNKFIESQNRELSSFALHHRSSEDQTETQVEERSSNVNVSKKEERDYSTATALNMEESESKISLPEGTATKDTSTTTRKHQILKWTQIVKEWIHKKSPRLSSFPLPVQIQDSALLYYDVFLLLNLSVSISFWVVHRLSFLNIIEAFSEGCLLCILWIIAGLYNGAFLYSAIDGHYDMTEEHGVDKGGPKAAGLLGLWTFVGTINLRLVVALVNAFADHRQVGITNGEELIPLELCFGLVLMSMWRMLHSSYSSRL